jgi:Protein of unknown function (DUF2815)
MTQQRQYEAFTLFNVRIVDMRHLWSPSDSYKGQKQQKPNYFAGFIVPKTQATWHAEPALAGLVNALGKLYASNPQLIDFRIENGDTPNAEGKSSEFAKGHWLFNASSGQPPTVELVQAGGSLVKLPNKVGVKSGDFCMVGGTAAVSGQNNRAAKLYLNAVVFTAPGEEIVFANSVSGAELMQQAQRQGLAVAGFAPAGAPGFTPGQFQPPPQQQGFAPTPGGFAPQAAPAHFGAPAAGPGTATGFPSNPAPGQFGQPPAFAPQGGQPFPQR